MQDRVDVPDGPRLESGRLLAQLAAGLEELGVEPVEDSTVELLHLDAAEGRDHMVADVVLVAFPGGPRQVVPLCRQPVLGQVFGEGLAFRGDVGGRGYRVAQTIELLLRRLFGREPAPMGPPAPAVWADPNVALMLASTTAARSTEREAGSAPQLRACGRGDRVVGLRIHNAAMIDMQEQAWLDQQDTRVAQSIRRHGLFVQFVFGDEGRVPATFAYTVGLFGLGHAELVVVSVDPGTAAGLLNHLGERIYAGENLIPGQLLTFDEWTHRVTVEELPNPGEIVFSANRHYQRPPEFSVPAYQLTSDDQHGRFPWEPGYADGPDVQPRPGTWRA